MTTLSEIAYNVLNLLRGGRSTTSEILSLEQVKFNIEYYRALLIRRELTRESRTYEFEQDLGLIPVAVHSMSGSDTATMRGFTLRTTKTIPSPLRMKETSGITFVGSADRRVAYPVIHFGAARYQKYNKVTKSDMRSFELDGYIHIIGHPFLNKIDVANTAEVVPVTSAQYAALPTAVAVRGIFERPKEAHEFITGNTFDEDTTPYPISLDYVQRITQSLLAGEYDFLNKNPTDTVADQQ